LSFSPADLSFFRTPEPFFPLLNDFFLLRCHFSGQQEGFFLLLEDFSAVRGVRGMGFPGRCRADLLMREVL
jgi:hypothetical protein